MISPRDEELAIPAGRKIRDTLLSAARNEATERVPVWFMRQAGRSSPEYRALRERYSILQMCREPELAVEVTLQPLRRFDVDAAIMFSDIVVPLAPMGVDVEIRAGAGPMISAPIRSQADVGRLRPLDPPADLPFVIETVRTLVAELDVPLIGFGGGPFTLASYLVEGGPSRTHLKTKSLMYSDPSAWSALMDRLADAVLAYLRAQIEAGAAAVQLFDSWVGALSPADYVTYAFPYVERILSGLEDLGAPRIHFGVGTGELLTLMHKAGADVMGIDWRVPLDEARARLGGVPVQGNLDPALLLAPWEVLEAAAIDVLERGGGRGHIFNLGHGVHPESDPDRLARLVDLVHSWEPR